MFGRLFRRDSAADGIATSLYGAIVAQARNPALYTVFDVPDTVTGRFEMVVLHLILVLDRLHAEGDAEKVLGQGIFDLYCTDMDRSLREMGIGDLGVPKRMKKMAQAFYGRAGAYREALATRDAARLAEAIARNVFPEGGAARGLAAYAIASAQSLAATSMDDIRVGRVPFGDIASKPAEVMA
jgi:cytochrome b pre-mRNA-processing protein 3